MEEGIVYLESSTDLTPVLEAMETLREQLETIAAGELALTGVVLGGGAVLAGTQLLHFYSSDAAVIAAGYERLRVICGTYLLCGIMDTLASSLRGLGYSVLPMVVSLVGSCLLRLVWIATIFQLNRTPFMLYISYPISWVLTAAVHLACLLVVRHKMRQRGQTLQAA